jgi:hypothetical protein
MAFGLKGNSIVTRIWPGGTRGRDPKLLLAVNRIQMQDRLVMVRWAQG